MNEELEVIKEMFAIAKEFSEHENNYIYELSHYLSDNIITKIALIIAKKYNLQYKRRNREGNLRTYNFPKLYKDVLKNKFPNLPDYNLTISQLHNDRNIYQHGEESLRLGIRKEIAKKYVDIVEEILIETKIIGKKNQIKSASILKKKEENYERKIKELEEAVKKNDLDFIKRKIPSLIKNYPQNYLQITSLRSSFLRCYEAIKNLCYLKFELEESKTVKYKEEIDKLLNLLDRYKDDLNEYLGFHYDAPKRWGFNGHLASGAEPPNYEIILERVKVHIYLDTSDKIIRILIYINDKEHGWVSVYDKSNLDNFINELREKLNM